MLSLLFLVSCVRAPLKGPENALREASAPDLVELKDDLPLEPLLAAIETQITFLQKSPNYKTFVFGERTLTKEQYLTGLKRFVELGRMHSTPEKFYEAVENEFEFYEVYGNDDWGEVFMTSYYEPVLRASKKRTSELTQPLYKVPEDIYELDLGLFDEKFSGERRYKGRLVGNRFVPYYSREEIDVLNSLKGKKLEIAWVDPLDAFMLHVQGSGTLEIQKGKKTEVVRVGYANQNGHRYESVGKFLKHAIPLEEMSLHTIEQYLRSLHRDEMQRYLNMNPSYIFFQVLEEPAITYLGVSATEGRTIATDGRYFPKGGLAYLISNKPKFDDPKATVPASWEPMARFVLDQDVGGAIKGGGRLDLFWGRGDDAKRHAGVMKQQGKLYYLVPKNVGDNN